jgi:hypothetical protein
MFYFFHNIHNFQSEDPTKCHSTFNNFNLSVLLICIIHYPCVLFGMHLIKKTLKLRTHFKSINCYLYYYNNKININDFNHFNEVMTIISFRDQYLLKPFPKVGIILSVLGHSLSPLHIKSQPPFL